MTLTVKKYDLYWEEILNLRNKACQEAFYHETETNDELLKCFENDLPLLAKSAKWKKTFENVLHKCFKKIRIVKKKEKTNEDQMLLERVKLKKEIKSCNVDAKMKEKIEERIKQIEETIGEDVAVENHKVIIFIWFLWHFFQAMNDELSFLRKHQIC